MPAEKTWWGKAGSPLNYKGDKLHIAVAPSDIMVFPANDENTKFIKTSIANA